MPDAERTVQIIFEGVDRTNAAVQSVIGGTRDLASNVEQATAPIANLAASALQLEAALLATGAVATGFAVSVASEFDASFREIATLIGQPVEELGEFRQAILDYATSSTQPLEEVTGSIYSAISAGVEYADSIDIVRQAEQLAVAGRADLNDSLLVLASSLNAYGLSTESAERFSDALFATVRQGLTTLPQLAEGLNLVTGSAATLGIPFETVLAAVATLTASGASTSQALTQLNSVMTALIRPSDQARDAAERLGIEFDANAIRSRGLEGVLQDVAEATNGSEEEMGQLFGRAEALRAVFPLTGVAAETFADNLDQLRNSTGQTAQAFEIMSGDLSLVTQQIQNAFEGLLVGVGSPLLDEFGSIAASISAVFAAISGSASAEQGMGELVAFVESQAQSLEGTMQAVAANIGEALESADYSGFIDGINTISGALGNLFDGVDLTTAEGLESAIEGIGFAFESLSSFTAGIIDSFEPLAALFQDTADGIGDIDQETFRAAGQFSGFMLILNQASGVIVTIAGSLLALNQALALGGSISAATTALTGMTGALSAASAGWAALGAAVGVSGFAVGSAVNEITERVTGTAISTWLVDTAIGFGWLESEADELASQLTQSTGPAIEGVGEATREASEGINETAAAMSGLEDSEGTWRDITGGVESASASIQDLGNTVVDAAGNVVGMRYGFLDAAEAVNALDEAAEDLSLDEKLAIIEAQSAVTTAQIEANADTMVAAIEGIAGTVVNTGDALGDLFGLLGNENVSRFDQLAVFDQIERENERRDDALEEQRRLNSAQISLLRAQADALSRDGALVTVNGDGLAPHLEAIMFELLEAIQVRVNQEGYALLLNAA